MREIVHGDDLQRVVSVAVRHRADVVVAAVNAPYLGFGERHADAAAAFMSANTEDTLKTLAVTDRKSVV